MYSQTRVTIRPNARYHSKLLRRARRDSGVDRAEFEHEASGTRSTVPSARFEDAYYRHHSATVGGILERRLEDAVTNSMRTLAGC